MGYKLHETNGRRTGEVGQRGVVSPQGFDVTIQPDGSIRLVELTEKEVPVVKPRRVNGRLRGAEIALNRDTVAAAVRAERDAR